MADKCVRALFRGAALYGLIVLLPMLAMEARVAAPAAMLAHPEYYYGFLGAAIGWQLVYWTIGGDPARFRAMMPLGGIAKLYFWGSTTWLWLDGRAPDAAFAMSGVDLVLAVAFLLAWRGTARGAGAGARGLF